MTAREMIVRGDLLKKWRLEAGLSQYRAGRLLWPNSRHPDKQWNDAERRGSITEEDFNSAALRFGGNSIEMSPVFAEVAAVMQLLHLLALGWLVVEAVPRVLAGISLEAAYAVQDFHAADIEQVKSTLADGDRARLMEQIQVGLCRKARHGLVSYRKVK